MSYLIKRVVSIFLVLVVFTVLVFWVTEILPGDAASHLLGQESTPADLAIIREKLGLNQPAYVRYINWAGSFLRGDAGISYSWNVPIFPILQRRLINSLLLAGLALAISIPSSILLGSVAGKNPGGRLDNLISYLSLGFFSLPEFVTGIFLIAVFSVTLKVFPATSSLSSDFTQTEWVRAVVLPSATLVLATLGYTTRLMRTSMIETLKKEYIMAARARGIPEKSVIYLHALRNALIPVIPAVGLYMGWMIGGLVLTETVFAYPGIGSLFAIAIANRDIPLIQSTSVIIYMGYAVASLLTDIFVVMLNPRVREVSNE